MGHEIELAYVGLESTDTAAINRYLGDVIGLMPGQPTSEGHATWRVDDRAQRVVVQPGRRDDAAYLGFEAVDAHAFERIAQRLRDAGAILLAGGAAACQARRVSRMLTTTAPWGVRLELVLGLQQAGTPFHSEFFPEGFVTQAQGFGHAVFVVGTEKGYQASLAFAKALGLKLTDWLDMRGGPAGLHVSFLHCNARHHSLALSFVPIGEVPQALHHINFEVSGVGQVGAAYERVLQARSPLANLIGQHDNDAMVSFYGVSPGGWRIEIGATGRVVDDDWQDIRAYDRISRWGHQPPELLLELQPNIQPEKSTGQKT